MNKVIPNISHDRAPIRQLDDSAINRIAAGEVVERPASAVKELVENALDAQAGHIDIAFADGGKTLVRVSDDGYGISAEELTLALSRHATSKIDGSDLFNIHFFGFRGEALPSLGAVARLSITSRISGQSAAQISVAGGRIGAVKPAALNHGTIVTMSDLFYATPARLKFMRSDKVEAQAIVDCVKRLAMASPHVAFCLRDVSGGGEGRVLFRADASSGLPGDALHQRLARVLGREFIENAMRIDAMRDGVGMSGYAALPTYSRGAAVAQYFFVNGRPVRDRQLLGALRAAYSDVLARDRHPAAALFIDCDPAQVDVNVHPAKSEVRFRDPALIRGLIITGLRHALAEAGHRSSTTLTSATLGSFARETNDRGGAAMPSRNIYPPHSPGFADIMESWSARTLSPAVTEEASERNEAAISRPLGAARAQIHETYIIAQTETGMVIVDQHAAHERLVYERLKAQRDTNGIARQVLLIPEIVELSVADCARLIDHTESLARSGLVIEPFGPTSIAIRETPALLGSINASQLLRDVLDELVDLDDCTTIHKRMDSILSRMSCHGSIRAGRRMVAEEMNALLREMESTPLSGQCNHGRPTYVTLQLDDIERLFGRK